MGKRLALISHQYANCPSCTVFSSMTAKSIIATGHDAAEITELKLTTCSDLGTFEIQECCNS